jgi:hypothetical protein
VARRRRNSSRCCDITCTPRAFAARPAHAALPNARSPASPSPGTMRPRASSSSSIIDTYTRRPAQRARREAPRAAPCGGAAGVQSAGCAHTRVRLRQALQRRRRCHDAHHADGRHLRAAREQLVQAHAQRAAWPAGAAVSRQRAGATGRTRALLAARWAHPWRSWGPSPARARRARTRPAACSGRRSAAASPRCETRLRGAATQRPRARRAAVAAVSRAEVVRDVRGQHGGRLLQQHQPCAQDGHAHHRLRGVHKLHRGAPARRLHLALQRRQPVAAGLRARAAREHTLNLSDQAHHFVRAPPAAPRRSAAGPAPPARCGRAAAACWSCAPPPASASAAGAAAQTRASVRRWAARTRRASAAAAPSSVQRLSRGGRGPRAQQAACAAGAAASIARCCRQGARARPAPEPTAPRRWPFATRGRSRSPRVAWARKPPRGQAVASSASLAWRTRRTPPCSPCCATHAGCGMKSSRRAGRLTRTRYRGGASVQPCSLEFAVRMSVPALSRR